MTASALPEAIAPGAPSPRAVSPASFRFWAAYVVTMRPYLCFVSGASGILGLALAGSAGVSRSLAAGAVFMLSYGFGQALTDVFQTDTDAISAPYRPLTRGVISRAWVATVSLCGLLGCAAVLALLNRAALPIAVLCVVGLASYSWFKRRWWGGPPWNSWIVAALPLLGAISAGAAPLTALADWNVRLAMLSAFFSYAVFVLLGYFKDISADRETGYRTLPVTFGWTRSLQVSAALGTTALLAAWALALRAAPSGGLPAAMGWMLLATGSGAMWWAHHAIARTRSEQEAYKGIVWSVRAHVLLQLALAALLHPPLALPILALIPCFELAMRFRPERTQV